MFANSSRQSISLVFQAEEAECGLACLAMLCSYHNGIWGLNLLRQLYGSTRGGISLSDLVRFSSYVGLRLIPEQAQSLASVPLNDFPCIALWEGHHFVVIEKDSLSNHFLIHDPAYGSTKLTGPECTHFFSGQYLKSRIIPSVFKSKTSKASHQRISLPAGLKLSDIGVLFTLTALLLFLISGFFTVGNAQVQDLFFNWIVEMQMKQWSTPLAYVQIATGLLSSVSLFAIALIVAKKYTHLSLKWNVFLFNKLLRLPEEYYLSRRTGDTISRFNYADNILRSSQSSLVKFVIAFVNLSILLMILWLTNMVLLILVIFSALFAIGLAVALTPSQRSIQQQVQNAEANVERLLYDLITDFDQIRLEGREQYYLQRITQSESERITLANKLAYSYAREEFVLQVLDNTSSVVLLIAAGILIMSGQLTLGQYAAIDVLISTSLSPLMSLSSVIRTLQETNISFKRLSDITDSPIDQRFSLSATAFKPAIETDSVLQLQDVSFSYSIFANPVISNSSLEIKAADFPVLIQGDSGSGKSTLARLLSGRCIPRSGSLSILGNDVQSLPHRELNRFIQLVDGLPFIRGASILDNLLLGSDSTPNDILQIIESLGIEDLPLFSITNRRVSSSFRDLSGGELILIQVIRSLARRPRILVLDESIAAISAAYRSHVVSGIIRHCPLSIFISHEVPDKSLFNSCFALRNRTLSLQSSSSSS